MLFFYQQDLFAQQQLWTTNGEVFLTEQLSLTRPQKLTGATKMNKNASQIQDKRAKIGPVQLN